MGKSITLTSFQMSHGQFAFRVLVRELKYVGIWIPEELRFHDSIHLMEGNKRFFFLSWKLSFDDFSIYFKSTNRDYAWFGVSMHAEQLSCTRSIVLISILVFNFCLEKDEVILMTVSRMPNLFVAFVKMLQRNLVFVVWETISSTLEFKSTGKVLIIKKYVYVLYVSTMEKSVKL